MLDLDNIKADLNDNFINLRDIINELLVELELFINMEIEYNAAHCFLDECVISGDGTEPLVERIGMAVHEAYQRGLNNV